MRGITFVAVGHFLAILQIAECHRMCLNYESPIRMEESFALCHDFETFGCCSTQQDADLHEKYLEIMEALPANISANCSKIITDLMCQVCSEYSAHRYNLEKTGKSRSLPGLCQDYCNEIFDPCRQAIAHITDDRKLLNLIQDNNKDEFCNAVKLSDSYYCYPPKNEYESGAGYVLEYFQLPKENRCSKLCIEEVANRIYSPTSIKHAHDGSHRLFVTEQIGIVWTYLPNWDRIHPPFLNISTKVVCEVNGYDERGLLDIEFHPNHTENRLFYVYYNTLKGRDSNYIRISELKVSANDMNRADDSHERILLEIFQPYRNHNGGQLLFGPDGYLYVFVGDGGAGGDPHNNSQNKSSLLGKVLRIDPRASVDKPYSVPEENPFVSHPTARPEIYAYGLRNPWRCSFNPQGRLYCGDVGQESREEIDIIVKGGNYGWRAFEADLCYDEDMCHNTTVIENHIPPIHSYDSSFGRSITGGFEYRGCLNSKLQGAYIYGDFMSGRIAMLRENKRGEWIPRNVCMPKKICSRFGKKYKYPRYILSFGEDEAGELYLAASTEARPGSRGGRIYKLSQGYPTNCASECNAPITRPTIISQDSHLESFNLLPDGEIDIRLRGSNQPRIPTKGRIELRPKNGKWSTICGNAFTIENAHVICRMLGFVRAREFSIGEFGAGSGKIRFENLQCSGTEDHIDECNHSGWQPTKSCSHIHDACVWCETFTFASLNPN